MIHVLAEVDVADVDRFLAVFGSDGLAKRREHGSRGARVLGPVDDAARVIVLLDFDTVEAFEAFRTDPEAPPIMRSGGAQGPPRFTVTRELAAYPH